MPWRGWRSPTAATFFGFHLVHDGVARRETMFQHLHLHLNERAVLVRDGRPEKALGPGGYTFWKRYEVVRWNTDELTFTAPAAVLAALPNDWFETIPVARG